MHIKAVTRLQIWKTISYRVLSSGIGFAVLLITTGNYAVSGGFSAFELLAKPLIYFLHEKAWQSAEKRAIKKTA